MMMLSLYFEHFLKNKEQWLFGLRRLYHNESLLFAISRGIYFSVIPNVVFLQRNVWVFFPL
jgi:hypothetical protein